MVSERGPSSASTVVAGSRPVAGISTGTSCSAKRPSRLRGDGALVASQREGVLVGAGDAVALGDVLGGLAHRLGRVQLRHPRVDEAPAERRVVHRPGAAGESGLGFRDDPGRPAHRLDAAGEVEVAFAEAQRPGGLVDGLETGGAEAVHGDAGDLDRKAGEQRRHPGDVAVVLAGLVGGAHVDVADLRRVEPVALDRGADDARREVIGAHARERAAVAAHRGSQGVDDQGLAHGGDHARVATALG